MISFIRLFLVGFLMHGSLLAHAVEAKNFSNNKEIEELYNNLSEEHKQLSYKLVYELIPIANEHAVQLEAIINKYPVILRLINFVKEEKPSGEITISSDILFSEQLEDNLIALLKQIIEKFKIDEFLNTLHLEEQEEFDVFLSEALQVVIEAGEQISVKIFEFPELIEEITTFLHKNPIEITFSLQWEDKTSPALSENF